MSLASLDSKSNLRHQAVMMAEVAEALNIKADGLYIDATVGGGGHTRMILERLSEHGRLIGLDRDPAQLPQLQTDLAPASRSGRLRLLHGTLADPDLLDSSRTQNKVDGILFDLGLSSLQLDNSERGFSYSQNGPLDMRLDTTQDLTAAQLLNQADATSLARLFKEYGDEPQAKRLANGIIAARPLHTTVELNNIIVKSLKPRTPAQRHQWLARNFMAVRIAVNQELQLLHAELQAALKLLRLGGRLVVLSFHSGEDRLVKNFMRDESKDCLCSKKQPICQCGHRASLRLISRKPGRASRQESSHNPRARSALLRVAEKIA